MLGEETIPAGEAEAIRQVVEASRAMFDTTERPAKREQHAKHHGCVHARFLVEPDLPPEYRVGLFREPGASYPAWIRFSNGAQRDDTRPDAHGMAIKLMSVEGTKVLEAERDEATHDFILVDNPVFFIRDAIDYVKFTDAMLKALGKRPSTLRTVLTPVPETLRKVLMLALLYFLPLRLGALKLLLTFVSKKIANPLTTQYWSTTPYLFGPGQAVKYAAIPEHVETGPVTGGSPDYLGKALADTLKTKGVVFQFKVQPQVDTTSTPIEDPTVLWPSPFRTVARIEIPAQEFQSVEQMKFCEHLSFTPWHTLPEHRPLGGINRARKTVYTELSTLRHQINGVPRREPRAHEPPVVPEPTG